MNAGYIYVAFNPEMPHCLKVGLTTRTPRKRLSELSGTSTPVPFRLLMQWSVTDTHAAERAAHKALSDKRVSANREFFRVEGPDAISIVGKVIQPYLAATVDTAIRDRIDKDCRELAEHFFTQDFQSGTPISPEVTEALQSQIHDRAVWMAEWAAEDGMNPEAVLTVMELVWADLEGPAQYHLSPTELAIDFQRGMGLLMNLLSPAFYLQCGVTPSAAPALQFCADVSRVVAHAMLLEEEEDTV